MDRRTCHGCGGFLPQGASGLCDGCEQFLAETPMPCPMGCGRTTEDVAGGPCEACWELAE